MRILLAACALALAACSAGPSSETLIDELRVVAAVAESPEISPGESTDLAIWVADPLAEGAEVLVWSCVPGADGCLEAAGPPREWLALGTVIDGRVETSVLAPASLSGLTSTTEAGLDIPLWVLACAPGLCPLLEDVRRVLDADAPVEAELAADLADPGRWMDDVPLLGVSLAYRTLRVSDRAPTDRNHNPLLTVDAPVDGLLVIGEEVLLGVQVIDAQPVSMATGLTTAGGFSVPSFELLDGSAKLRWYAPEEGGEAEIWVVVSDGEGGSAVWYGSAEVSP